MHESLDAPVVVAFADLVDSTALLARLGDAHNDEIRQDFFAALRVGIARCHGREIKTQGDGFMVTFRFAGDAVRCATLWHRSLAQLAARPPGLPLALRVGIAAGDAIFDEVEDDWFGTAVVEAARLCSLAPTSGTLVTPAVRALGHGGHSFVDFGSKILKGFPDPVQLWLVDDQPADDPAPAAFAHDAASANPMAPLELDLAGTPPLIGRTRECDLLRRIIDGPIPGRTRLIQVTGEAGVGTSRLAAEALVDACRDPDVQVLYGRAAAGQTALRPVLDAIRWWVASIDDAGLTHVAETARLRRHIPLLDLRLGALAPGRTEALDAAHAPDPGATATGPPSALDDVDAFLVALAAEKRVILMLDDADMCDQQTVALLDALLARRSALTVVLSHRSIDDTNALGALSAEPRGPGDAHEIRLDPLDHDETIRLVSADLQRCDLPHPDLDDAASATIHEATSGRPERILAFAHHFAAFQDLATAVALTQPYKGLIPFGDGDRSLFFGRTALIDRCVTHFAERGVLVLVGNSGSGKSSLLHAGIVPALVAQGLFDEEAVVELRATPTSADRLASPTEGSTVWIIDQFEELFTAVADVETRELITDTLISRLGRSDRCILALRGDFYGHLASLPRLAELVDGASVLVGPPTIDDLHEIIQAPASLAGVALEGGLVEKIIADVAAAPGGLPLLSHALFQTWNRQRDATLTLASYIQAGGAEGSIAASAEHVHLSRLDEHGRQLARLLFRSLVNPAERGPDTRRRMSTAELAEFRELPGSDTLIDELLEARLVTVDADGLEVAHEAIIAAWPRLRGWIDEERAELLLERRIANQAASWESGGRQDADLLRSGRLAEALAWEADRNLPVPQPTRAYLDASIRLRDESAAETARQLAVQRRANRRLRGLLAVAALLIVGVGVLIAVTRAERDRATRLARTANAQVLAEQAGGLAATDPNLARLLAVEAHDRSVTPETKAALFTALLGEGRTAWTLSAPPADADTFGATATRLVWLAGPTAHLTNPETGRTTTFTLDSSAGPVATIRALSPDGTRLVMVHPSDPSRVDVARIGDETADVLGSVHVDGAVTQVRFSADGATFGVQTDTALSLFDARSRAPLGPAIAATGVWALDASAQHVAVTPSVATQYLGDAAATPATNGDTTWEVSVFDVDTAKRDTTVSLGGPAAHLALSDHAIVVAVQDQNSSRIPRVVEFYDRATGRPTVESSPDTDVFELADGRIALVEPGVVTLWAPGTDPGSSTTFELSEQPTFVWSSKGRLFAQGAKSVRSWETTRQASVVAGPSGPANIGRLITQPNGSWIAVTDFGVTDDTGGGTADEAGQIQTFLVDADTIGTSTPEVLGPVPGAAEGFVGSTVVVDGVHYSIPSMRRVSGPPLASGRGRPATISLDGTVGYYPGDGGHVVALSSGQRRGATPQLSATEAQTVALSHDGGRVAWFDASTSTVVVAIAATRRRVTDPIRVGQSTSVLAFGPDDDLLATGDNDGRISLYRVSTGQVLWTSQGASARGTQALSWSPEGTLLVASMDDRSTMLLQAVDGQRLGGDLPTVRTTPANFIHGGSALVIPTLLGVVRVDLDVAGWPDLACANTDRSLTRTEWEHYLPGSRYRPIC
ncbi:MAG TPA: AAA family ATPase [Acidimicrobiales bacterium]|nr:AAA family ATPase [Acidimicrobiales bacterium]